MRVVEIVPSRRWRHKSGRAASVHGACPWTGRAGDTREDWTLEVSGWTWLMSNGTVGLGRVPATTYEEAETIMRKVNAR